MLKNKYLWIFVLIVGLIAPSVFGEGVSDFERVSPFSVKDLWLMKQARAIIESYQVDAEEKKISEDKIIHEAIRGMVGAWSDPYTRFVNPDQLKNEQINIEGQYGGLGMYIGERDGKVLVISPIEDTPADKAGIKPKDQIVKVNDEVVVGFDSQEVVNRLRGTPGTAVTVWMRRESEDDLLKFDLVREIIKIESVKNEMLSDNIGYLRLTQFKKRTDIEAEEAIKELIGKGAEKLILDLRNNGGGLIDVAVNISSFFLSDGKIVETKGRMDRANEVYNANLTGFKTKIPLVVLINEGSASASEIVAGALMDRNRAVTIGKKSFGKGSVQLLFNLTDGSGIFVTIAKYFTPSGRVIDHVGLPPTIEVDGDMDKDRSKDKQLQRAIEEISKII
ncbi:MAG: S41 family peptidase [Synergistaceae bacterium]|nr:S41 family peptidase [Synergistaceae bacterium]